MAENDAAWTTPKVVVPIIAGGWWNEMEPTPGKRMAVGAGTCKGSS